MNNKTIKTVVKGFLISVVTLIVGFFAISLPFRLFDNLSDEMMQIVFIGEIVIYAVIGGIFLLAKEKSNKQKAQKKQEKMVKEQRRIQQLKALEQFNMVA